MIQFVVRSKIHTDLKGCYQFKTNSIKIIRTRLCLNFFHFKYSSSYKCFKWLCIRYLMPYIGNACSFSVLLICIQKRCHFSLYSFILFVTENHDSVSYVYLQYMLGIKKITHVRIIFTFTEGAALDCKLILFVFS